MSGISEWIKKNIINKIRGGVQELPMEDNRLLFVTDPDRVKMLKIDEYGVWYEGDSDGLLNFYTSQMLFEYNFQPFFDRNKRNYFWAVSSIEAQIKRTHSGLPRDIVDTLVAIMPFPIVRAGKFDAGGDPINEILQEMIRENGLQFIYRTEQMPMTLVEGWGCYKLIWDKRMSDNPIVQYYRAAAVDFIYKNKRIIGAVFKDFYEYRGRRYLLLETRYIDRRADEDGEMKNCLVIEYELFDAPKDADQYVSVNIGTVPELSDLQTTVVWGTKMLFCVPCIFFKDNSPLNYAGRSIFTGKIDLLDDLDQTLSQASTCVKLSTPKEYFNSEYLERDKNGLPIRPSSYDRKYVMYEGQKDSEGNTMGDPIIVTQPRLDTKQYSDQALAIMLQIMNGIMSPATLGIDIAKKDNAEAQREKEKVTIFTRNTLIAQEELILHDLFNQMLCMRELMSTGKITVQEYDISIKYSEFADASYENKMEVLGKALNDQSLSPTMYVEKLYGNSLGPAEKERELNWLIEAHKARNDAINEGMAGIDGNGENIVESVISDGEE